MRVLNRYKSIQVYGPEGDDGEEYFIHLFRDYDGVEKMFIGTFEERSDPRFNRLLDLISEEETIAFDNDPANKDFLEFLNSAPKEDHPRMEGDEDIPF